MGRLAGPKAGGIACACRRAGAHRLLGAWWAAGSATWCRWARRGRRSCAHNTQPASSRSTRTQATSAQPAGAPACACVARLRAARRAPGAAGCARARGSGRAGSPEVGGGHVGEAQVGLVESADGTNVLPVPLEQVSLRTGVAAAGGGAYLAISPRSRYGQSSAAGRPGSRPAASASLPQQGVQLRAGQQADSSSRPPTARQGCGQQVPPSAWRCYSSQEGAHPRTCTCMPMSLAPGMMSLPKSCCVGKCSVSSARSAPALHT